VPVGQVISAWYAANSEITRIWVYEATNPGSDRATDVSVVVALAPVCDSDDIEPIWLARCAAWKRDLERIIGRPVELDRIEEGAALPPSGQTSEPRTACLANIGWRYIE
jgi:hypothetical protein